MNMKMTYKKILCLVLAVVMTAGAVPAFEIVSEAAGDSEVFTSGDGNWQYIKQTDGMLYSRGKSNNYCAKLVRYLGNDINVSIPNKIDDLEVFIIGEKCFYGDKVSDEDTADIEALDSIKSISIGPDIYEIEDEAFAYMDSLEEVMFAEGKCSYLDFLVLGSQLFKESRKLENFIVPEIHECDLPTGDPFSYSYIKNLTIPAYMLYSYYGLSFANSKIERLTVTGSFEVGLSKKENLEKGFYKFFREGLKEVIFEGEVTSGLSESNYYHPGLIETSYRPVFIFHHIPNLYFEQYLENSGYIRNCDYETGTVSFSINNTPDTRYISVTEPVISGDFEYSLTEDGKAVITDYYGLNEHIDYPDVIDGYEVIAIGSEKDDNNRLNEIRDRAVLSIAIPEGVEYIGRRAFYKWQYLEEADFPESLKIIDGEAFFRCNELKEILLPDITYLGFRAFGYCRYNRLTIPGTLKEIPMFAFNASYSKFTVEEISIAEGVETIGTSAFKNIGNYNIGIDHCFSMALPSTLKYIGDYAFCGAYLRGDLIIPDGVEEINFRAFGQNKYLNSVVFSEGLKHICEEAFENSVIQSPLIIPDSVLRIDQFAFKAFTAPSVILPLGTKTISYGCFHSANLDYLHLPSGLNVIGEEAFGSSTIGELTIPNSVSDFLGQSTYTKIGSLSFGSCSKQSGYLFSQAEIDDLTFTEGDTYIQTLSFYLSSINKMIITDENVFGKSAFTKCTIKQLEISESVSDLNESFYMCSGMEKIVFEAKRCTNARGLLDSADDTVEFSFGEGIEYIPAGLFKGSKLALEIGIPLTVTHIFDDAFKATDLTEITLSPNLVHIGNGSFADCTKLERVIIPETVSSISENAFSGCTNLESVDFLSKNCAVNFDEENYKGVFDNCPNLSVFNFADGIKYIPDYLLYGCAGIESVTLPDSVTDIGSYTFANTNLKNVVIPENVESIGEGCFENCSELETIVINGRILLIGDNAFGGCDKIREIYIADSVKNIGKTSFANCTSLETVYMSRNVVYIPDRCFENCTALSSFIWEADSKLIGKLAFAGCTSLTSFNFVGIEKLYPNSFKGSGIGVASLGEAQDEAAAALEIVEAQSFMNCPRLQSVALGGNISTVQSRAFANCENLETAIISDSVETISSDAFENCPKLTIYCSEDSYAYNYAVENNIPVSTFVVEPIPNQRYTGKDIEPTVSVSVSGAPLSKGVDFKVRYSDNVNAGTANVKVSGINTYKMFTSTVSFVILTRDISEAEIKDIDEQKFTGSAVTPKVRVTYNGKTLREGTDYNVVYSNNTTAGTAKATLTGIGNFSGTAKTEFSIVESSSPITPPWHGHDEDPEEPVTPPENPSQPDNPSEPGDTPGDDSGDNDGYIMRVLSWFTGTLIPFVFRMLSAVISLFTRI